MMNSYDKAVPMVHARIHNANNLKVCWNHGVVAREASCDPQCMTFQMAPMSE